MRKTLRFLFLAILFTTLLSGCSNATNTYLVFVKLDESFGTLTVCANQYYTSNYADVMRADFRDASGNLIAVINNVIGIKISDADYCNK